MCDSCLQQGSVVTSWQGRLQASRRARAKASVYVLGFQPNTISTQDLQGALAAEALCGLDSALDARLALLASSLGSNWRIRSAGFKVCKRFRELYRNREASVWHFTISLRTFLKASGSGAFRDETTCSSCQGMYMKCFCRVLTCNTTKSWKRQWFT